MPISLTWDNPDKTILRLTFWNEWDLEEYTTQFETAFEAIELLPHTVDILVDLRTDSFVPKGNTLHTFRQVMDKLPANTGIIVYVNDDNVQRHMINTHVSFYYSVRRASKRRLYMVETMPEAYELIKTLRTESES